MHISQRRCPCLTASARGDAENGTNSSNDTIVDIACTTCYVTGSATWDLSLQSGYNLTAAFETAKNDFETVASILATDVEDFLENVLGDIEDILED